MSVTIGKLVADYNSATFEERQRSKDFEVVPRKVVEDIIEECKRIYWEYPTDGPRQRTSAEIISYAENCLKAFEEGVEE